jgi:hypothetical protein
MDYPKEGSSSLYDYSDKSIPQAGYAAIVYAVVTAVTTALWWLRTPAGPWIGFVIIAVIFGGLLGVLAFGIFRRSRVCVVILLIIVICAQLYTWFVQHSAAGSLISVVVAAFLLRGARRIFQDHAERAANVENV